MSYFVDSQIPIHPIPKARLNATRAAATLWTVSGV